MRIQITLTVAEAKILIAKGLAERTEIKSALTHGKIFLKGGTTVSAICEELCGKALRISGRITPKGTKGSKEIEKLWHCALIEKGHLRNIDGEVLQWVSRLTKDDVVILGANAFDTYGNAAMMMGRALGGEPGTGLSPMMGEVNNVIIAVGTEKLVPGNLNDIIRDTGRSGVDLAMGMAVGLMPICGEIFTEIEAIKTLGRLYPQIIGKGGIKGAEGATTITIDGEKNAVLSIFQLVQSLKAMGESGVEESFEECEPGNRCKYHRACIYARNQKF